MAAGPQFSQYDLGTLQRGSTVVVTLRGSAANVRLMDSTKLRAFKAGKRHRYHGGGLVKRSPHRIVVPSTGHWYATVDMIGLRGSVRSSVVVEPPPLPTARSASTGSSLRDVQHEAPPPLLGDAEATWDVFVAHASEDKVTVARPLAEALRARGLDVWLDDFELKMGDSLRRRIDAGLARSSFGVVVFSRPFFTKGWTQYELDGIVGLSVSGKQKMLPIWHDITKDEVSAQSPSLVDKVARSTAQYTIKEIADEIAEVVGLEGSVSIDA